MPALYALYLAAVSPRTRRVLGRLALEICVLLDALLSPGKQVAEVEAMRKQQTARSRRR